MSPRASANTSTTVKPSLPFKVTGNLLDGEAFEFPCSKVAASKAAKDFMRQGLQNIEIYEHDGTGWVLNTDMLEKVKAGMTGNGNTKGVLALQQLQQRTDVIMKLAAKAQKNEASKENFDSEVNAWLQQIGATCKALNVTPHAINTTIGAIYQPQEA